MSIRKPPPPPPGGGYQPIATGGKVLKRGRGKAKAKEKERNSLVEAKIKWKENSKIKEKWMCRALILVFWGRVKNLFGKGGE